MGNNSKFLFNVTNQFLIALTIVLEEVRPLFAFMIIVFVNNEILNKK